MRKSVGLLGKDGGRDEKISLGEDWRLFFAISLEPSGHKGGRNQGSEKCKCGELRLSELLSVNILSQTWIDWLIGGQGRGRFRRRVSFALLALNTAIEAYTYRHHRGLASSLIAQSSQSKQVSLLLFLLGSFSAPAVS